MRGSLLLRVNGDMKPSEAEVYEDGFTSEDTDAPISDQSRHDPNSPVSAAPAADIHDFVATRVLLNVLAVLGIPDVYADPILIEGKEQD